MSHFIYGIQFYYISFTVNLWYARKCCDILSKNILRRPRSDLRRTAPAEVGMALAEFHWQPWKCPVCTTYTYWYMISYRSAYMKVKYVHVGWVGFGARRLLRHYWMPRLMVNGNPLPQRHNNSKILNNHQIRDQGA